MKTMYYIAILPPEDLLREIRELKKEIFRDYGSKHALRSPAHITLQMPFHFEETLEEDLITRLRSLTSSLIPFACTLKDFDHFGDRVVFIDVKPDQMLSDLRRDLQELLRTAYNFSEKQLPKRFHPHITIANRDLTPDNFKRCWETFATKSYQRTFCAEALFLLKHRGDHWEAYREIPFNQP